MEQQYDWTQMRLEGKAMDLEFHDAHPYTWYLWEQIIRHYPEEGDDTDDSDTEED